VGLLFTKRKACRKGILQKSAQARAVLHPLRRNIYIFILPLSIYNVKRNAPNPPAVTGFFPLFYKKFTSFPALYAAFCGPAHPAARQMARIRPGFPADGAFGTCAFGAQPVYLKAER
jgi:hypothetical protein